MSPDLRTAPAKDKLKQLVARKESHPTSWRALLGKVGLLRRLKVFDSAGAAPLPYAEMTQPGAVSIVDLSDTDSPQVNNLAIAELLRGVHEHQEAAARVAEREGRAPTPVVVFIEEAHEFLSGERIAQMPHLFEQVARIARRGRKRWLGLVFITQLPQHLPNELFGLVNNYILHKISDAGVIDRLQRAISGIDASLWTRLPGLAPGQAIVSFTSLSRPLLTAIDPAPCKLRMVE
jgi:DNA helicase HerA-like ATPase